MERRKFGKFTLTEQIAVGGMAEIFRAEGNAVEGEKLPLAIKCILPQYSNDNEFISLLIDEAKLMVFLNHPNIVPIIEFGKVDQAYYIAMEYVDGINLKNLFARVSAGESHFPIDLAVHIVREVGHGLAYAHRKTDPTGNPLKIVHRDISPANILVSFQGDVKLTDFGISKAANQGHRTQTGIIRGKTGYMSPEQTHAQGDIDHRSDIYSLGIVLYELLTGVRLFQAQSVPEALKMVREAKFDRPSKVRKAIPKDLENIVMRALAFQVDDRYQSAEAMVDDLSEFLATFSPGGRQARVSSEDLAGFVRRHCADMLESETEKPKTSPSPPSVPPSATDGATLARARSAAKLLQQRLYETFSKIRPRDRFENLPRIAVLTVVGFALVVMTLFFVVKQEEHTPVMTDVEAPTSQMDHKVFLQTEPAGADVYVNGKRYPGKTPLEMRLFGKSGDRVELRFEKRFYHTKTKAFRRDQMSKDMVFFLESKDVGLLQIHSEPSGADVQLNGTYLEGVTPLELEIPAFKSHNIRVTLDGYAARTFEATLEPGQEVFRSIVLQED